MVGIHYTWDVPFRYRPLLQKDDGTWETDIRTDRQITMSQIVHYGIAAVLLQYVVM